MLENINYSLSEVEVIDGEIFVKCVVVYKKDGSICDKFNLVIDENKEYLALTLDTRFKVRLRKAIEQELNSKLITA